MIRAVMDSPVGMLTLLAEEGKLIKIGFDPQANAHIPLGSDAVLDMAKQQLSEYFLGTRKRFDLPLDPRGTAFQRRVWAALCDIPYGTTETYGQLAARIGQPKAARAVGQANNRNKLPIVIPCHRVIGADGALVGYSDGVEIKRILLAIEAANC